LFDVVGDLAVAAAAAAQADDLRVAARRRADAITAGAEAGISRRQQSYVEAWAAALAAGWTVEQLRAAPLGLRPPAVQRRRRRTQEASAPTPEPTSEPTPSDDVPEPRFEARTA